VRLWTAGAQEAVGLGLLHDDAAHRGIYKGTTSVDSVDVGRAAGEGPDSQMLAWFAEATQARGLEPLMGGRDSNYPRPRDAFR
jgi:hypothetical protein